MGEIEVSTSLKESEYNLDLTADMGNIKVDGKKRKTARRLLITEHRII